MAESKELKKIKKMYGEDLMKLCRDFFPTILEKEGLLTEILTQSFATNTRTLFDDLMLNQGIEEKYEDRIRKYKGIIDEFVAFVFEEFQKKINTIENIKQNATEKTPYELLTMAGYDLYECKTEKDVEKFKKYYREDEELCTFNNIKERLSKCVVFFAIKKNVDEIKREDFIKPQREDEYGISVISIQFDKALISRVSIKNRYNHTVLNPDATFGNDLDRIINGLSHSFAKLLEQKGMVFDNSKEDALDIPGYICAVDGKFYKYNMQILDTYYCPGNIIVKDGIVKKLEPEKQELIDYFIIDKRKKTLKLFDKSVKDGFIEDFKKIKKIEIRKSNSQKEIGARVVIITLKNSGIPIIIEIDRENNIVKYQNNNMKEMCKGFLKYNIKLKKIEALNLEKINDNCLEYCEYLSELYTPKLKEMGNYCLRVNDELKELRTPKLEKMGDLCLLWNKKLKILEAPNLIEIGKYSLMRNTELSRLYLPELIKIGEFCLRNNKKIKQIWAPKLRSIGEYALKENNEIRKLLIYNIENSKINSRSIARLSIKNKITTSEVNLGKRILKKIVSLFKKSHETQR